MTCSQKKTCVYITFLRRSLKIRHLFFPAANLAETFNRKKEEATNEHNLFSLEKAICCKNSSAVAQRK